MSPSPFHGIFSAFGQDSPNRSPSGDSSVFGFDEPEDARAQNNSKQNTKPQKGQIAVDIFEQEDFYVIRAPIAGIKLCDLDIEVDEKALTIRGARRRPEGVPDDQYYVKECFWGEFSRTITLPCAIDPKKVRATFSKDSILKVLIPKEEKVKIVSIQEG